MRVLTLSTLFLVGEDMNNETRKIGFEPKVGSWKGIIRLQMVREGHSLYGMKNFMNAKDAVEAVSQLFRQLDREMMVVVSLDTKLTPIAAEIVAIGGIDNCMIDVRNIFKHAIICNATSVICFHNHPTGIAEPSKDDITITKRIKEAGDLLGISLLDHIIIGDASYYSILEHNGSL